MNPLAALGLTLLALAPEASLPGVAQSPARVIDPQASQVQFAVATPWRQTFTGRFAQFQGRLDSLDDGRVRLHLQLDAGSAVIPGHPSLTQRMHGQRFFAVASHPAIGFESEPFSASLLQHGGMVDGHLTLRGQTHVERLVLQPAGCNRPGIDCAVAGTGMIDRSRYGMDAMKLLLRKDVTFHVQARFAADA